MITHDPLITPSELAARVKSQPLVWSEEMKNDELIAAGHELAKCLDNEPLLDIAKMIVRLADKFEVTTLALREMTKKRDAEHSYVLAWEKTMFKVCGEDGIASVAEKFKALQAERDQLAAENAALKDLAKGWANATDDRLFEEHGEIFHDSIDDCEAQLKTICPATDAFLREVRAKGVEMFADSKYCQEESQSGAHEFAAQLRQGGAA
ncbi:hypothetical protein ACOJCY_002601 [Cronobacter dublinensis]